MPPEGQQATSMRDDFEAAIENLTPAEDTTSEVLDDATEEAQFSEEQTADNDAESTEDSAGDDAGDESEEGRVDEGAEDTSAEQGAQDAAGADDVAADSDGKKSSKDSIKAPVGWSPKARQYWSKLPREVQELVAAREQEVTDVIANTKAARQTHDAFTQLANSYAPVLAAEGVDPMQATQSLFQTVAQLRMGTPAQKAEVIAELIGNYDVDIGTLDAVLTDQPVGDPEEERLNAMFEQRFGPMLQAMQGMQGMQQHAAEQRDAAARDEVVAFSEKAEFLDDVRLQMADLIDMAHARGQQMTLEQAYDVACRAHPEISAIMQEREKAERIKGAAQSVEEKRKAASSLSGRKTGAGGKDGNLSLRDSLSDAWDNQGRA